jgi:hypothetical protein
LAASPFAKILRAPWVHRLAAEYALDYKTFCRKALHLSGKQISRLYFEIPSTVVVTLSEGTCVPDERIEEMTLPRIMERIERMVKEYQRKNPAGSREPSAAKPEPGRVRR